MNDIIYENSASYLKTLAPGIAGVCVTSPPYFNHREYGCQVRWSDGSLCELGQERFVGDYLDHIAEVMAGVYTALDDRGALWLNLGQTWAKRQDSSLGYTIDKGELIDVPSLVATRLRVDGWKLISVCIWHKPDAMPSPAKVRPSPDFESVLLLTKSVRGFRYYYENVLEPYTMRPQRRPTGHKRRLPGPGRVEKVWSGTVRDTPGFDGDPKGRRRRSVWSIPVASRSKKTNHPAVMPEALAEVCILASSMPKDLVLDPFAGSGTTGAVAKRLGRRFLGIEAVKP